MPVDSVHQCVADMQPEWQKVRDTLAGPRAIKSEARRYVYLPRLPGQRMIPAPNIGVVTGIQGVAGGGWIDEYAIYLSRAVILSGFAERVLHGLVGMVVRKEPEFEVPAVIDEQMENITLDGTTDAGFTKQLLTEDLSVSWGGVLVDWSERFARPYQRLYCAEDVQNWRIDYLDGQPMPTRIVLAERVPEPDPEDEWKEQVVEQRRVLELVPDAELMMAFPDEFPFGRFVHRVFRKVKDQAGGETWMQVEVIEPMRRERPLGFIPFQPFNALEASWKCAKPALGNLVDMILAHYRNSADYENAIHCAGVPTLAVFGISIRSAADSVVTGQGSQAGGQVEVGAGRVIIAENPAGHAEYVQTGGLGAAEIKEAMERKESQMATMAARLLLSEQRRVAETAEAQRLGFAGDDASLTSVVEAIEQALTNTCTWHAWWAGTYETVDEAGKDVSVKLNREFLDVPLAPDQLNRLGLEVDAGRLTEKEYFWNAQRGGRIPNDEDYDEHVADLAAEQAKRSAADQAAADAAMANGNGNPLDAAANDAGAVD